MHREKQTHMDNKRLIRMDICKKVAPYTCMFVNRQSAGIWPRTELSVLYLKWTMFRTIDRNTWYKWFISFVIISPKCMMVCTTFRIGICTLYIVWGTYIHYNYFVCISANFKVMRYLFQEVINFFIMLLIRFVVRFQ